MFESELDLDHFFSKGFVVRKIKKDIADSLLENLKKEIFLDSKQIFDVYESDKYSSSVGEVSEPEFNVKLKNSLKFDWENVVHPDIWIKGVNGPHISKKPFNDYPEIFKNFWQEVEESMSWFTNIYGNFTHRYMLAHRYLENQSLGWHHDLSDSTWFNNILYLGDTNFNKDDGGYLSVCECSIDDQGLPTEIVSVLADVLPNHGTLITLDNMNPRILHKVYPLMVQKDRFTLSCQFGYIDNILSKKN